MPGSRALKNVMRGNKGPVRGSDPLYSDKAAAKGKPTRQYKTETKKGVGPNYRQDGDAKGTEGPKLKMI